jgi:hypothetical protein
MHRPEVELQVSRLLPANGASALSPDVTHDCCGKDACGDNGPKSGIDRSLSGRLAPYNVQGKQQHERGDEGLDKTLADESIVHIAMTS